MNEKFFLPCTILEAKSYNAVDLQREELIAQIEGKLQQQTEQKALFSIRWRLA
jgi:hypothetical protein